MGWGDAYGTRNWGGGTLGSTGAATTISNANSLEVRAHLGLARRPPRFANSPRARAHLGPARRQAAVHSLHVRAHHRPAVRHGDNLPTPWSTIESWATQIGDSLLKTSQDAAKLYADWRFAYDDPAGHVRMDAWEIGMYRGDSGVRYALDPDAELSTLQELQRDKLDVGTDALIVQWPGGQIRVPEEGGSRCGFLQLPAATVGEAQRVALLTMARHGQPEQVTLKLRPTGDGDVPGKDWKVGDIIHVDDSEGGTLSERAVEWQLKIAGDDLDFTVAVKDLLLDGEERLQRHIQSMGNGSMGGEAPSAPAGRKLPDVGKAGAGSITFHLQGNTNIGDAPVHNTPTESCNLFGVRCALPTKDTTGADIVTTADTVTNFWVMDAPGATPVLACTVTIPAGQSVGLAAVDPLLFLRANKAEAWPEVTASADEATEMTVTPLVF